MKFNIGDVVQLKSGGPNMTITGEEGKNILRCVWMDRNDMLQIMTIVEQALVAQPVKSNEEYKLGARFFYKRKRKECTIVEVLNQTHVKCKLFDGSYITCFKTSLSNIPSKKVETDAQPDPVIIDINAIYIGQHLKFKDGGINCLVVGKDLAANKIVVRTLRYGVTTESPSSLKLADRFQMFKVGDKVKTINGIYCTIDSISPSGAIICGWLGSGSDRHKKHFNGTELTKICHYQK